MARVRCPNCQSYHTHNIKTRLAKLSAVSGGMAIIWFILSESFAWEFRYGVTGIFLLGGLVLLIVSFRTKSIQYCHQCKLHFYPDNVPPSVFDRFH